MTFQSIMKKLLILYSSIACNIKRHNPDFFKLQCMRLVLPLQLNSEFRILYHSLSLPVTKI